jgi:hypothetical protein
METNFDRHRHAMARRAVKALLIMLVVFGGGYLWHSVTSERIAARAEQARLTALQMTPRKWAALEREAARDAAAKAFAERLQAEQAVVAAQDTALSPGAQ